MARLKSKSRAIERRFDRLRTGRWAGKIKIWYVYILRCKSSTLYTGITTDVKRRFREHCNKSARYTSYNPPQEIVHTEKYGTRSEAMKRESEIKSWNRSKKLDLIRGNKPHGHHLVEKDQQKKKILATIHPPSSPKL